MSLLDLRASELLERLAAATPTPGGGSAAALAGAVGAALVEMVCGLPKTRTGAHEERTRLDTARALAREAGERLRRLVDEDTSAFDAVMAAYRLPKASEEEKASRARAIAAALARATEVPLETAERCRSVLAAAAEAAAYGSSNVLSDARTAAVLALSGLLGAAENVRINATAAGDAAATSLERVEVLVREARARVSALGLLP